MIRRFTFSLYLTICLMTSMLVSLAAHSQDSPQTVLVSIHPVALLVKSAWPQLNVETLVPKNQSPHDFTMKPSDRQQVERADLIVWLGKDMEPYLEKVLSKRHNHVSLVADADHHHDPHIWLAPQEIPEVLSLIQDALKLPTPDKFLHQYRAWLAQSKSDFKSHSDKGFVAYHDAFHHWVEYFDLNQIAEVTLDPEQPVGSRHLVKVRKLLEAGKANCILVEPQFTPRLVTKLTSGLNIRQVQIDPIASTFNVEDGNFLAFYQSLTNTFKRCISP